MDKKMTGHELNQIRKATGLNRVDFAAALGVSERTYRKFTDSDKVPGPVATCAMFMEAIPVDDWPIWGDDE